MAIYIFRPDCAHAYTELAHSSSPPSRLRFVPDLAFVPGPQFGAGLCWYRTNFTLDDCVTDFGWCVKFASLLVTEFDISYDNRDNE